MHMISDWHDDNVIGFEFGFNLDLSVFGISLFALWWIPIHTSIGIKVFGIGFEYHWQYVVPDHRRESNVV